jgi:cyanophycinase-like exopeptidase
MGRLIVFIARILRDGWATQVRGIGIDDEVALGVEADGSVRVFAGQGFAYMIHATTKPEQCNPKTPLTFNDLNVYRLGFGSSFNITTWDGRGGVEYQLDVRSGVISSNKDGVY